MKSFMLPKQMKTMLIMEQILCVRIYKKKPEYRNNTKDIIMGHANDP